MSFNAQAYLESLERPTYVDRDGNEHVGAVVSAEEWRPVQEKMHRELEAAKDREGGIDYPTLRKLVREMTRVMFPAPWWKRLSPVHTTVTQDVLALPPMGMLRAVWSFMQSGARAAGVELEIPDSMKPLLDPSDEVD